MVSPVEQAAASAFFNVVFGWLFSELQKNYRLWRKVWQECESLQRELLMLASAMDEESRTNGAPPRTATARAFSEEMRDLTHDIEDCIERFLPRLACKEEVSWPGRSAQAVKTSRTRLKFAKEIKKLHARSKEARIRIFTPPTAAATTTAAATSEPEPEPAQPDNPVGISEATVKLRSLLLDTETSNRSGPDPAQLTVVVIVGFGGSGKTTLARAVFDSLGDKEFPSRAWVSMRLLERRDAHGVRAEIHKQLRPGQEYSEKSLTDHLEANGYLVVIDDIKMEHMKHWDHIRKIFKGNGRIIVTTAIQSIANTCSSLGENNKVRNFGYVYKMRTLGKEDSRLIALQGRCTTEILENSAHLLKKCDGLPLALASVAKQLDSEDEPTGQFCSKLCSDLGSYLHREDDEEPNFARLRGVLMDNYTSLSNYTVRTCLLYLSIFPADRPVRRNVIIRRWMAEGYARSDPLGRDMKIADGNFKTFVDRNIIHAEPSQNAIAKKCKTPGIMHEFMLHKSMSKKFIMPFGPNKQKKVRHLFIHNNNDTDSRMTLKTDLSCVRSLTVLGNAGVAISDFRKYKLIRVLDLEECTDVNDGHLIDICKLWNLRYLSLGRSITAVPKEIGQLKFLETLVVSKTRVNVLPIEVIGLPCLIHLVGKLKLQDPVNRQQLPTERKMKMLTGFIADGSEGFLQLMEHMTELNKIKIWCETVAVEADQFPAQRIAQMNNGLTDAIQKYIEAPIKMGDYRALSIDFQALPEGYLHALRDLCNRSVHTGKMYYLNSLKLYGNTSTLPEFVRLFRNLSELCLSTNVTQEFLSALGEMTCLLYLKLIADRFDSFTIQAEKFKSLRRMCFVFKHTNPALLTISCGALPELTSLQLICEHLVDLCVIQLRWINQLKEIVLHPAVGEQTIQTWETAAMKHPNRPNVFPNRRADDPRNEPAPDQTGSRPPVVAPEALARSSMSSGHRNSTSHKLGFPVRAKTSGRLWMPSFLARRRNTYENFENFGKY